MAYQDKQGYWHVEGTSETFRSFQDANAAKYKLEHPAKAESSGPGSPGLMDFVLGFLMASPVIALICVVLLILLAGFRGFFIIAKTLPLFGVAVVLAIAAAHTARRKLGVGILGGFLIANILMVALVIGSYQIYARSNLFFASMYSADYIQELPDGGAPTLYEKRFQKGDALADLTIGESVTVNGITMDYKEYNITTEDGVTGWVEAAAFSEEAAEMLAVTIGTDGFESSEIQSDGRVVQLLRKYMIEQVDVETVFWQEVKTYDYEDNPETIARMSKPNVSAPLMLTNAQEILNGGGLEDSGAEVTITGVLYAEDCTIIRLSCIRTYGESKFFANMAGARGNTNEWKNALTVTDLDTGEKWPVMPFDYWLTDEGGVVFSNDPDLDSTEPVTFFFPPFASRHFSLTHEGVLPHPDPDEGENVTTGYGGLLGLISNWTSGQGLKPDVEITFNDYNFPEVWVN